MSEALVRTGNSHRAKVAYWLLSSLAVAAALAGYAFYVFGGLTVAAAVLIAVSSFLAIGLCALLLLIYDKRANKTGAILYGRILHGLMLHGLFVAAAAWVHAANASQYVITFVVALTDAALAATVVLLLADVRMDWGGAAMAWVWAAFLLGVAVFMLCYFGAAWIAWLLIAALAAATVIVSILSLEMRNNLCNLIFAFAIAFFAALLLFGEPASQTQLRLNILCLMLTPIYALAVFLRSETNLVGSTGASESGCLRNGRTVIYSHASVSPAETMQAQNPDGVDTVCDPQATGDPELAAIKEKVLAWKAEEDGVSDAMKLAHKDTKPLPESDMSVRERNCNIALDHSYRLLSLRYLSIAPLKAFSGISEEQIACMDAFGVHTVSELAALPMCRVAEQIVLMASHEEKAAAGE